MFSGAGDTERAMYLICFDINYFGRVNQLQNHFVIAKNDSRLFPREANVKAHKIYHCDGNKTVNSRQLMI